MSELTPESNSTGGKKNCNQHKKPNKLELEAALFNDDKMEII
jgi:hypothetical protein